LAQKILNIWQMCAENFTWIVLQNKTVIEIQLQEKGFLICF